MAEIILILLLIFAFAVLHTYFNVKAEKESEMTEMKQEVIHVMPDNMSPPPVLRQYKPPHPDWLLNASVILDKMSNNACSESDSDYLRGLICSLLDKQGSFEEAEMLRMK